MRPRAAQASVLLLGLLACSAPAPAPAPFAAPAPIAAPAPAPAAERAPEVGFTACTPHPSPAALPLDAELKRARAVLVDVVHTHARDPLNPWAVVHGLLALGPDMTLDDGRGAVPWLFEGYAEPRPVGGQTLVGFPAKRPHPQGGPDIRIEPHTDLILKALTEAALPMDTSWLVQGQPATLGDLYRHSLWRTWVSPTGHSFRSLQDAPWTLQALASVAPPGLRWQAQGGHSTSLDAVTDRVVEDLRAQTGFMHEAMAAGVDVKKERQGIFAYPCGGQHTLQGAAHAVARGFGGPAARSTLQAEVPVLYWRLDVELRIYDAMIAQHPQHAVLLLEQRLKFLGHFLESAHKLAAYGLYTPDSDQRAALDRARRELVATVDTLGTHGAFTKLPATRSDPRTYQMYLDFVGDAAHAVRGIDLATGAGTVCW